MRTRIPRPLRKKRVSVVAGLALVVCVITVSAAGGAPGGGGFTASALTPDSTFSASKSDSGQLAETDPSLLNRTDATPVPVMIKYDYDATASYTGGVGGLAATSPSVTGRPLDQSSAAVNAYDNYAENRAATISQAVEQAVPAASVGAAVNTVYGGAPAVVPANSVNTLLTIPGVAAIQKDSLNQPLDDNTSFIGATNVWPTIGGSDLAGSNVIVGVIDTGIWPENPMFAAKPSEPAPPHPLSFYHCDFGDGTDVGHLGPTFACNNKLIGAYNFTQTYMASQGSDGQEFCNNATPVCSARDSEGHGTHTIVDGGRRLRVVRGAVRRPAWSCVRYRPGRARDHVPRLPRQRLLQLRLGERGQPGDP